jgi:hypothetical protein
MEAKISKLIDQLIKGTQDNTFTWEETGKKTAFRLKMVAGAVEVERWNGSDENTGVMHDMVDITFLKPLGEKVDKYAFSDIDEPSDHAYLSKLHDAARRNALRVDEVLAGLFGEIERKVKKT